MNKIINILLLLLISLSLNARIRYVSTRGNDNNSGADSSAIGAWKTWKKGFQEAMPGDTVYFMGGVYYSTEKIKVSPVDWPGTNKTYGRSGTREKPIMYASYPGQWAILDCENHKKPYDPIGNPYYNTALEFWCVGWIHLKDFEIRNVYQLDPVLTGIITSFYSVYMTFEHLVIHNVQGRAMQVESGAFKSSEDYITWENVKSYWDFDIDTIRFINLDIYDVADMASSDPGNGGDVFHTSMYQGNVYMFEGCRIWHYTDDGFNIDGGWGGKRIVKNCWMMPTTKWLKLGAWASEMNGIKGGWNPGGQLTPPGTPFPPIQTDYNSLEVSNCLVMFGEQAFRDGPNNIGFWHNNTAYKCAQGFYSGFSQTPEFPQRCSYKNNLVYKPKGTNAYGLPYLVFLPVEYNILYDESNNSWISQLQEPWFRINQALSVDHTDFEGLTGNDYIDSLYLTSLFLAPRQPDGSLPENKPLSLSPNSRLIDKGTTLISVGTQNEDKIMSTSEYYGAAPDIGYAEFDPGGDPDPDPDPEPLPGGVMIQNGRIVIYNGKIVRHEV